MYPTIVEGEVPTKQPPLEKKSTNQKSITPKLMSKLTLRLKRGLSKAAADESLK